MSPQQPPPIAVTLLNCDQEPIHIPGSIQPHGALFAFDANGELIARSANTDAMLGMAPPVGTPSSALDFDDDVRGALRECIEEARDGDIFAVTVPTRVGDAEYDFIANGHDGQVFAEFERRHQPQDVITMFALKAHRLIERLRREKPVEALLKLVATQMRELTGFDRVMVYRFRHDDSGDVVAEARRDDLAPYLGLRYPASDIPAQARRLYLLNTLRLIPDSSYQPVPLLGLPDAAPIDMSHCVLRSVSPIHLEYLRNMGVAASMSVSIVLGGRLWGLIACHHMTPLQVPYSIRMTCDVLSQVVAARIQTLLARERSDITEQAAALRNRLMEGLVNDDDPLRVLEALAEPLREALGADALVMTQHGKIITVGDVTAEQALAIAASMSECTEHIVRRECRDAWPEPARTAIGRWVGLLGLGFDPAPGGWILALRAEQIETVRWGGKPEKVLAPGPNGQRLSPRGSFDAWEEIVTDSTTPWDDTRLDIASSLLAEMHRAMNNRHADYDRARTRMLAMLGHDLRDPLQAISMAGQMLQRGDQPPRQQLLGTAIRSSSNRMERLISQVLDVSRISSGIGLGLVRTPVDLAALTIALLDEARTAHPGASYAVDLPTSLIVDCDADRIAQALSNLLSNARHHAKLGNPVGVRLGTRADRAAIEVRNVAAPIPADIVETLFTPFKTASIGNERNRGGIGLGLYIAHEIALGHGGALQYRYDAPDVVFTLELPLHAGPAPAAIT